MCAVAGQRERIEIKTATQNLQKWVHDAFEHQTPA
jgi:hypothetical protein